MITLPVGRLQGTVRVPGSKSVTNRALVAAALASGESVLFHPLDSDDTRALAAALSRLGARIGFGEGRWTIAGPLAPSGPDEIRIDIGPAGTPARFLTALLSAIPGRFILDGSSRMRERPMGPLVAALRTLGAEIEYAGEEERLPLKIRGGTLGGGSVKIRGDVSSQFLSALMLASPLVKGGIELDVQGEVASASYLSITKKVLSRFLDPEGRYRAAELHIPGDDSAACFPIAGALISGGRVAIKGLERDSDQPDALFRSWASLAGGRLNWSADPEGRPLLLVDGAGVELSGIDADVNAAPDAALPLAALLSFAKGRSQLTGVERLAEKESDRFAAALDLLKRAGSEARAERDPAGRMRLVIDGFTATRRRADFAGHCDHRVAMSAAVLALVLPEGSTLDTPEVVSKSYPAFFSDWARLTALKAR